jgi:two-component system sensor histidine kinase PilS (NtrC family)
MNSPARPSLPDPRPDRGGASDEEGIGALNGHVGYAVPERGVTDDSAHRRVFMTYLLVRVGLGLALVVTHAAMERFAGRSASVLLLASAAYAAQAVFWWLWPGRVGAEAPRLQPVHWWATVAVDVLAFGALHGLDSAGSLNHGALLVLPVLMSGILSARVPALGTASAAALLLLLVASDKALQGGDVTSLFSQAGLAGAGLIIVALVAGQMASRLAVEERAARGNMALVYQQAELNRLVIDDMTDGVLVVDRRGEVRAANPAARLMLAGEGSCPPAPFLLATQPSWRALHVAVQEAYALNHWPSAGLDLTLGKEGETLRGIRVRARFTQGLRRSPQEGTEPEQPPEVLAVLFAEPLSEVLARQKKERLVAMGRISAGIAHEIRNPLAAVAQANALLQEDVLRPDQQRLVRIVADNVERLKRIVSDVLDAAQGSDAVVSGLEAGRELATIIGEWAHIAAEPLGPSSRVELLLPDAPLMVLFDPDHFRRVMVNLLDNSCRYASAEPGAVRITVEALESDFVRLAVASDGAPITPEVEPRLFEPFHSTRSRGTGLGLYICRELCERHSALIEYVQRPGERHRNVFLIVMRRASALSTEAADV